MDVVTTTWSPAEGWHHALPEPDGRSALVVIVGDPSVSTHRADPIGQIWEQWRDHAIVGCSSRRHAIDGDLLESGLSVAVLRFDRTEVRQSHHEMSRSGGARRTSRRLATDLAHPLLRGVLLLGDGLTVNPTAMLLGFTDILPGIDVVGGTSSDGVAFSETWTIVGGQAVRGWISAIGLVGEHVRLGHGSGGGWEPDGEAHIVTSSYGNVVYTIDDEPALELHRARHRPVLVRDLDDQIVTRSAVEVDHRTGAIRYAGDVMQGGELELLHASADSLVHGAHLAAKQAAFGREQFALACIGAGRHDVLRERASDEIMSIRDALVPSCRLLSLQTYAELSSPDGDTGGHADGVTDGVRNGTAAITTIGESLG